MLKKSVMALALSLALAIGLVRCGNESSLKITEERVPNPPVPVVPGRPAVPGAAAVPSVTVLPGALPGTSTATVSPVDSPFRLPPPAAFDPVAPVPPDRPIVPIVPPPPIAATKLNRDGAKAEFTFTDAATVLSKHTFKEADLVECALIRPTDTTRPALWLVTFKSPAPAAGKTSPSLNLRVFSTDITKEVSVTAQNRVDLFRERGKRVVAPNALEFSSGGDLESARDWTNAFFNGEGKLRGANVQTQCRVQISLKNETSATPRAEGTLDCSNVRNSVGTFRTARGNFECVVRYGVHYPWFPTEQIP